MKYSLTAAIFSLVTLGATMIGPAPASYAQTPETAHTEIPFDTADLIDPARFEALQDRINAAAREVCSDQLLGDAMRSVTLQICVRDTRTRALAQLETYRAQAVTIAAASVTDQG